MGGSNAGGNAPNGCFGSLELSDDTGGDVTVTTGGTFQPVLHASLLTAGLCSKDALLVPVGTTGKIPVPASKLGKWRFWAKGSLIGTNAKTVQLRPAIGAAAFASGKGAKLGARVVMPATAEERAFAIDGIVNIDAAGDITLQVTSTSNSDVVTFRRLQWGLEFLEAA